jgi:hypothetical protein
MQYLMGDFRISGKMMRYSLFVPRFYNFCKSYGFTAGRIMPSRAFCSDENQGYPIILITQHFGTFPFNHGRVGGIVSTQRHGPHAHHGKDLALIQASHVGYDPETGAFGAYRRLQIDQMPHTASCGKIGGVMDWYLREFAFARENVSFARMDGEKVVVIDNMLLDTGREEGLLLSLDRLIDLGAEGRPKPRRVLSTSKAFRVHPDFEAELPASVWQPDEQTPIGERLTADLFRYQRRIDQAREGHGQLEDNLSHSMPQIVTSPHPALAAAQANTQIEFDRTYRTIIQAPDYKGRNLAFIAGIHIDISPAAGQVFPLTKFVPWAAYIQTRDGRQSVLEQNDLMDALNSQGTENPDRIKMDDAIHIMEEMPEISIEVDA